MLEITCKGITARCTQLEGVTSGTVGTKCRFIFDEVWDGLTRTAVFAAGNEQRDVILTSDECVIPWEVLTNAGYRLRIGVCGENEDGKIVIPTVFANCGIIREGANPGNNPSAEPTSGIVQGIIDTVTKNVEKELSNGDNILNTYNPIMTSSASTPVKEGTSVHLNFPEDKDTYFYLNLMTGLAAGKKYTLSFDATGVEDGKAPVFCVRRKSWGCFTVKNGRNVVTFIPDEDYEGSSVIIDDMPEGGIRPQNINVTLSNFKIERGAMATDYTPSLTAMADKLQNVESAVALTRSYTNQSSSWYCMLASGDFYVATVPLSHRNLTADSSLTVGGNATASQQLYIVPPYPTKETNLVGSCDRSGQYIANVNGYSGNGATIGAAYRVIDPQGRSSFSSTVRLQSMGAIVSPPAAPSVAYHQTGAEQAAAIAQSYVDAQLSGRTFHYGANFFHDDTDTINDASGAAMMQCDTYIGMVLRGIPYLQSPYANTTSDFTYHYDDMMNHANPNHYAWCDRILDKIRDQKYLHRDVKFAADYAWMCWGMAGSVFTDPTYAKTGDLVFWKRANKCDYFDNIAHVAMLKMEDGVPYIYEVTGSGESGGKVLRKVRLDDKAERPSYFARPDYAAS